MDDLGRFFRLIVSNLAASDPARLGLPLTLGEIRQTILPYRANRRTLRLESSEDYELMLIRLCAGEAGFARTEPDEVGAAFAAEGQNSNPDLTIVHRHEDASIILNEAEVARVLNPAPDIAFAPPDQRYAPPTQKKLPVAPKPVRRSGSSKTSPATPATCGACGGKLPSGRSAKFCPHCGKHQSPSHCPGCQAELEANWRHCVSCGAALQAN